MHEESEADMMGLEVVHHLYTLLHVNQLLEYHKKGGFTALIRFRASGPRDVAQTVKMRYGRSPRRT